MFKSILAFIASLVAVLSFMVPASAHEVYVYQGNDFARINSAHDTVRVHDKECDGHAVYVRLYHREGWVDKFDTNGCDAGGSAYNVGNRIGSFTVCEDTVEIGMDSCGDHKDI